MLGFVGISSLAGTGLVVTLFSLRVGLAVPASGNLCFVGDRLAGTSLSLIGAGLKGAFRGFGVGSDEGGSAPLDGCVLEGVLKLLEEF